MLLTQRRDEKSLVCLLAFRLIFDFLTPQSLRNPLDRQGRSMRISDRVNFGFCKCAPVLLSHRTLYLAYCTLCIVRLSVLPAGWSLVAAISRHSGLWSSSTHTRDIALFFQKPSKLYCLYRSPIFNFADVFHTFPQLHNVQGVVTLEARPPTQEASLSHYCNSQGERERYRDCLKSKSDHLRAYLPLWDSWYLRLVNKYSMHWVHCAYGNIWSYLLRLAVYSFCTSIEYLYICGMRYAVHYFESVSVPSSSSVSITQ